MLNCWLIEGFKSAQRWQGRLLARKQPSVRETGGRWIRPSQVSTYEVPAPVFGLDGLAVKGA